MNTDVTPPPGMQLDEAGAGPDRLSLGVAARLSRYLQVLTQAKKMGRETISSQELSDYTHVNSTQIRRDLSGFGKFGKRGVGYNVDSLVSQIRKILRTAGQHNIALFGAGHLGKAIASSDIFADHGFRVVAIFDADQRKVGQKVGSQKVRHVDELKSVVEDEDIVVGVLAVPTAAAQGLADNLVEAGVRIIFNYSEALLAVPPEVTVHTSSPAVDLLYALYFYSDMSPAIDLDGAADAFAQSTDFTVGIEEEFALLDPDSLDLVPRFEELRDAAADDEALATSIAGELISSEIEIRSGRGESFGEAVGFQRDFRTRLFGLAGAHGVALGSTGTHPWADYREQPNIDTEHYRRVVEDLQYVARRNNTFSLHVHVGVRDIDRAVRVCDRLRPVLPLLLAAGANSPFLDARDSGLHSARTQAFTKQFPRCGVPDAYGSWRNYRDYLELLIRTNSIIESTQVWWSVRPHLSFGTVEVRICDAQSTAAESEALAALIVACVAQSARDIDEGVPFTDLPRRLVDENVWRAVRYGMDGKMIDFERGGEEPTRRAVERLIEWTAPVSRELGLDPRAHEGNGAQRQRAMLAEGASMQDVYAASVKETRETFAYPPEVQTT